jgi:RimJ/RimL family protein N-acetyltransferase
MEYREEITSEMQMKWFQSINNEYNLYYIINVEDKEIGLINIKDINKRRTEGEGGIFIWDDDYLKGDISFRAVCCLYDFAFLDLGITRIRGHILEDNKNAITFNKVLGLTKVTDKSRIIGNCDWELLPDNFLNSKARKLIYRLSTNK